MLSPELKFYPILLLTQNKNHKRDDVMNGRLIVVGTPIGNLSDFSPRAIESLKNADFIAAEDTRVTLKLLNHFNIKNKLVSYYEHNKREKGALIISKLEEGQTCALVSDAGMPAISDPGEDLVRLCIERNIQVDVVPGPTALISALVLSGISTGRFTFEGFLSVNKKSRFEHLKSLVNETRTMIFYEAPHKLKSTLIDLYSQFGNRKIAIIRELTKIHEEVIRSTLETVLETIENYNIKGEIVIVLEGAKKIEEKETFSLEDAVKMAIDFISEGRSVADAAKKAGKVTGFRKQEIYKLTIKNSSTSNPHKN